MKHNNEVFQVLVVCTGNICRSPLAEQLLHHNISQLQLPLKFSSAGTHALLRGDIPLEIHAVAEGYGVKLQPHTPQQLSEDLISSAQLVLVAERTHRAEVVSRLPRANRKTYTLKQFSRILSAYLLDENVTKVNSFTDLVEEIADYRALVPPLDIASDDDIADPYLKSFTDYQHAGQQISESITSISRSLSLTL